MNCARIVICTAALIALSAQCANAAPALATNNVNMRQGNGHRLSRHHRHSGRQHRGHNRLPGRVVHGGLARPKRLLDCNELRPGQRPAARCRRSAPGSGRSATGGCRGRSAAWRCRPAATGRPAAARLSAARCRRSATRLPAPGLRRRRASSGFTAGPTGIPGAAPGLLSATAVLPARVLLPAGLWPLLRSLLATPVLVRRRTLHPDGGV